MTAALRSEASSTEVIGVILSVLIPRIHDSSIARDGVLSLLRENLQLPRGRRNRALAGTGGLWKAGACQVLDRLDLYAQAGDDEFRAALLGVIADQPDPDARAYIQLFRDAIQALSVKLRALALRGLLQVPFTLAYRDIFVESFPLILDKRIN